MDQREQINQLSQPETEALREERQREQTGRTAQEEHAVRAESIMETKSMLARIEEQINNAPRVTFSNQMVKVNAGDLLNLISRARSALPKAVQEAITIVGNKQQIELAAQQRAQDRTNQADLQARRAIEQADAQARQTLEAAQQRAMEIEQQARATAERILTQANTEAQMRTEDSEIVRRANARAKEIYDQVQMDVDGVYAKAYNDVNLLLSGATAALNRSAMDLANIRDQLLNPNGDAAGR